MQTGRSHSTTVLAAAALALTFALDATGADGTAKGELAYKARGAPVTVALKHAWLVRGPDAVDPGLIIRKLILSATDIGASITACKTMSCTDTDLGSGMTVELDAGPRINYWVSLNKQLVQYSGTARPNVLKLTTDTPTRLAGRLRKSPMPSGI